MEQVDCTERAACRRAIAFELTSVGLDTRFFRAAYCRESALHLLMLYRHPNG